MSVLIDGSLADANKEGSTLSLTLILTQDGIEDPHQAPFVGPASVLWSAPPDSGQVLLGLRFAKLSADAQVRLREFLAKLGSSVALRSTRWGALRIMQPCTAQPQRW